MTTPADELPSPQKMVAAYTQRGLGPGGIGEGRHHDITGRGALVNGRQGRYRADDHRHLGDRDHEGGLAVVAEGVVDRDGNLGATGGLSSLKVCGVGVRVPWLVVVKFVSGEPSPQSMVTVKLFAAAPGR